MSLYENVPPEFQNISDEYIQKWELSRISKPVLYEGYRYYEIVYNKKILFTHRKDIAGILLIDEDGNLVRDRASIKSLLNLFYYYDSFFGPPFTRLSGAYKDEATMEAEEDNYAQAIEGLDYLSQNNTAGALEVKPVLSSLLPMKKEANGVLKELMEKVNEYKSNGTIYSGDVQGGLMELYDRVMRMNFERIKLISSESQYYSRLKHDAGSIKRKITVRMDPKIQNMLSQVDNVLSFFINILNFYGDLVHYSEDRYMNHIYALDRQRIEKSRDILRNK